MDSKKDSGPLLHGPGFLEQKMQRVTSLLPLISMFSAVIAIIVMIATFRGDLATLFFMLNHTSFLSVTVASLICSFIVFSILVFAMFFSQFCSELLPLHISVNSSEGIDTDYKEKISGKNPLFVYAMLSVFMLTWIILIPLYSFLLACISLCISALLLAIIRSTLSGMYYLQEAYKQQELKFLMSAKKNEIIQTTVDRALSFARTDFLRKIGFGISFAIIILFQAPLLMSFVGLNGQIPWLRQETVLYSYTDVMANSVNRSISVYVLSDESNELKAIKADSLRGTVLNKNKILTRRDCSIYVLERPFLASLISEPRHSTAVGEPIFDSPSPSCKKPFFIEYVRKIDPRLASLA